MASIFQKIPSSYAVISLHFSYLIPNLRSDRSQYRIDEHLMRRIVLQLFLFVFFSLLFLRSDVASESQVYDILLFPSPVPEEIPYMLPYPGMLPDNPLYPLKMIRDSLLSIFTRDPVRRVNLEIHLGDKRLVMGKALWERQIYDLAISTISKGEEYLLTAARSYEVLNKTKSAPPGLIEKLETACNKHERVIENLFESTTNETKRDRLKGALGITRQTREIIRTLKR